MISEATISHFSDPYALTGLPPIRVSNVNIKLNVKKSLQVDTWSLNESLNIPQEARASVLRQKARQCQTIHMSNNEKQGWLVLAGWLMTLRWQSSWSQDQQAYSTEP